MLIAYRTGSTVTLRDETLREMKPTEIRLKVEACGICGTDLHQSEQDAQREQMFGHEMAGTVLEVGAHVTRIKVGQRVVIESATPCGECDMCRNTRQELCTNIQSFFMSNMFGFAHETLVPAICAIPCEDLTPQVSCLSEPLGVAIDLVRLADLNTNSNVLILGQGPIGLMALALTKQAGVNKVYVSDFEKMTGRKRIAEQFGADAYIDPVKTPITDYPFDGPIDRILVTAPPPTLNSAFQVACKGAIISFIGIGHGDAAFCNFNANDFHFKKLQLRASFASPALYTPMALDYLRRGVVDGNALISHTFPLEEMQTAMDTAKSPDAVKIVITQ